MNDFATLKNIIEIESNTHLSEEEYNNIMHKYGKENTLKLLHLLRKLENVVDEEIKH